MIYFVFFAIHELLSSIKTARAIKIVRGVGVGGDCARSRLRASEIAREQDCAGGNIARDQECAGERLRAIKTANE